MSTCVQAAFSVCFLELPQLLHVSGNAQTPANRIIVAGIWVTPDSLNLETLNPIWVQGAFSVCFLELLRLLHVSGNAQTPTNRIIVAGIWVTLDSLNPKSYMRTRCVFCLFSGASAAIARKPQTPKRLRIVSSWRVSG